MQQGYQKKILIISRPAIGDILLVTPLIHSIRDCHPKAIIDLMISRGQEGIVEGNPDIDTVLTIDHHPGARVLWALIRKLWRRYDIAIGNGSDDRSHFYLWLFGKKRVSVTFEHSASWKRWITDASFKNEMGTHVMLRNNALGNLLGYQNCYKVFPPRVDGKTSEDSLLSGITHGDEQYAVLHLEARLPYKRWIVDGWRDVAQFLADKGIKTYLTGGDGDEEGKYLRSVMGSMPASTVSLCGKLRFAEVSELIASCKIFVGVDTVNSHIAAAQGVPTVVLFGPEDPYRWGPWPKGHASETSPWRSTGSQRRGNVMIVQTEVECDTCRKGKCMKNRNRGTGCALMTNITNKQVIDGISAMLRENSSG